MGEPILEEDIDRQVERLRARKNLPLRQGKLLRHLINMHREGKFQELDGQTILLRFEEKDKNAGSHFTGKKLVQALARGRRLAIELKTSLREYYRYLPPYAPDHIQIVLSDHPDPAQEGNHRYEPQISWLTREQSTEDEHFWLVGDNIAAQNYVNEQMDLLNRIDETFVRWVDRSSSLYVGSVYHDFLTKLEGSSILYRAVLGPTTDSVVFADGGLREVLERRVVRDLPRDETATKLYRLQHATAIMNFTILYKFEDKRKFYESTEHTEVLFGYGVRQEDGRPSRTVVYRSNHAELVKEFQVVFDALRYRYSRPLDLHRANEFTNEPTSCDVLATFTSLPKEQVLRKVGASGIAGITTVVSDVLNDDYIVGRPHIKICVSALHLLDDTPFKDALRRALERGVQVSVALWPAGSAFINQRADTIGLDADDAERQVSGSFSVKKHLRKHRNLFFRECQTAMASVSIIWIDDFIYFSPYWLGIDVADGPHFLVAADSPTGAEIRRQYEHILTNALLKPVG